MFQSPWKRNSEREGGGEGEEKRERENIWWQHFLPTPFSKDSSEIAVPSTHSPVLGVLSRFLLYSIHLTFNNSQNATECGDHKGNPHSLLQVTRVSWFSEHLSVPRCAWPELPSKPSGLLFHLVTTNNTQEEIQANCLKRAGKGYFQASSISSCLDSNHKQELHYQELQGSQITRTGDS